MSELKLNQRERVLKYIVDFGYITSWQAYQDLGITQLGARIKELKDIGYQFKKDGIRRQSGRRRFRRRKRGDLYGEGRRLE